MTKQGARRLKLFVYLFCGLLILGSGMMLITTPGRTVALSSLHTSLSFAPPLRIINFGDAMFDRNVEKLMSSGADPLSKILEITDGTAADADMMIANLEGPITAHGPCVEKAYTFRFEPGIAEYLARAGFTHLNIANNHSLDCYERGLVDTRKYLSEAGIGYFGGLTPEDSVTTVIIQGKRVALVGIDETIQPVPLSEFYRLIAELAKENDLIIVNIHWGDEYEKMPALRQVDIGHALIDAGADVVFGHHPHVTQPIEIYKDGTIFYSLGNFVFDQITKEQNTGFGVGSKLDAQSFEFTIFPYFIERTVPGPLSPEAMTAYCSELLSDIPEVNPEACSFGVSRLE